MRKQYLHRALSMGMAIIMMFSSVNVPVYAAEFSEGIEESEEILEECNEEQIDSSNMTSSDGDKAKEDDITEQVKENADHLKSSSLDTTKPVILNLSLEKTNITAAETVEIYATAQDENSGIKNIQVIFVNTEYNSFLEEWLQVDSGSGTEETYLSGIIKTDEYTNPGDYIISGIYVYDNEGNNSCYEGIDIPTDLRNLTITVTDDTVDTTKPVILDLSLEKNNIVMAETVEIYATAQDENSGIKNIQVIFTNTEHNSFLEEWLQVDSGSGTEETYLSGTIKTDEYTNPGDYVISDIYVYDNAGNDSCYSGIQIPSKLRNLTITVNLEDEGECEISTSDDVLQITAAQTVYALTPYQVTFDPVGGVVFPSNITAAFDGSAYGELPTPSYSGHIFQGWYTAKDGGELVTSTSCLPSAENQILYAHWDYETYAVSFDSNGGTEILETKNVTYQSKYGELPIPERIGYEFAGWTYEGIQGYITSDSVVLIDNVHTLTAEWTAQKYMVTFNSNGGNNVDSIIVTYDSEYGELPTPQLAGGIFIGWFTNENSSKSDFI